MCVCVCAFRRFWSLVREESVFVDWQRVKVQESVDEVPAGSLPRTLDVIVRNKMVSSSHACVSSVIAGPVMSCTTVVRTCESE